MTAYHINPPSLIKIYVDGFRIDNIEPLKPDANLEAAALTEKVKEYLGEKRIANIVPVPSVNPQLIIITTELKESKRYGRKPS